MEKLIKKPFKKPYKKKFTKKKQPSKPQFRSGDIVSWCPEWNNYCYKVVEPTDKVECDIRIIKIKSLVTGTEFYIHEDVLLHRR